MLTQLMSVKIVKKGPDFLSNSQNHETAEYLTIQIIICFRMWLLLMWIAHPYPK